MIELIRRRTCCDRADDPHADPILCGMLYEKYELEHGRFGQATSESHKSA